MQDRSLLSVPPCILSILSMLAFTSFAAPSADWPQFGGPGGNAVSETALPPVRFGPSTNLLWKAPLPLGYSSPVVAGDRIFLTSDQAGRNTRPRRHTDPRSH